MWMTSCTGRVRGGFGEIWEKSVSWVGSCGPKKKGDSRLLAEARPVALWRTDRKVSIEIMCISLLMSKNLLTQRGNKKFRTWTKKSSSVFRISGFLYSMYICYEHSMYILHIRIWLWYMIIMSGIFLVPKL